MQKDTISRQSVRNPLPSTIAGKPVHSGAKSQAAHPVQIQRAEKPYVKTLGVLSGQLKELEHLNTGNVAGILHFFENFKNAESAIGQALADAKKQGAPALELSSFIESLTRFIVHFGEALASNGEESGGHDMQNRFNSLTLSQLNLDGCRAICMGLSLCASPTGGVIFNEDQIFRIRLPLQHITENLLTRAEKLDMSRGDYKNGALLDILNYLSRGLKGRLLSPSPIIKQVFNDALQTIHGWLDNNKVDLDPRQLGKCAVLLDIMINQLHDLVDTGHTRNRDCIIDCIRQICREPVLAALTPKTDAVTIQSICNLVKNSIECEILSGIASPESEWPPSLQQLARLISQIPVTNLAQNEGRTLSNCSNFLRILGENRISLMTVPFSNASRQIIVCINSPDFLQHHPSAQTVSNLMSFVKICDRKLEKGKLESSVREDRQKALKIAADRLLSELLLKPGMSVQFQSPHAIGGVLSGLAYLLEHKLVDISSVRGKNITTFLTALLNKAAHIPADAWSAKSSGITAAAVNLLLHQTWIWQDQKFTDAWDNLQSLANLRGSEYAKMDEEDERSASTRGAATANAPPDVDDSASLSWESPKTQRPAEKPFKIVDVPLKIQGTVIKEKEPVSSIKGNAGVTSPATQIPPKTKLPVQQPEKSQPALSSKGKQQRAQQAPKKGADTLKIKAEVAKTFLDFINKGDTKLAELQKLWKEHGGSDLLAGAFSDNAIIAALKNGNEETVAWLLAPETEYKITDKVKVVMQVVDADMFNVKNPAAFKNAFSQFLATLIDKDKETLRNRIAGSKPPPSPEPLLILHECRILDLYDTTQKNLILKFYPKIPKIITQNRGALDDLYPFALVHNVVPFDPRKLVSIIWDKLTIELVSHLLESPANSKGELAKKCNMLLLAALSGDIDLVKLVLKSPQLNINDRSESGYTALHAAVFRNLPEIVEFLLAQKGIDCDLECTENSCTPLATAVRSSNIAMVELLLDHGKADPNRTVEVRDKVDVEPSKHHPSLHAENKPRATPLDVAVIAGDPKIVQLLLTYGANANLCSYLDATALQLAATSANADVVATLIGHNGIDLDAQTQNGTSALHLAVNRGDEGIVKLLLHAGARPDLQNEIGATALGTAVYHGNLAICNSLIETNPNIINDFFSVNKDGSEKATPLIEATRKGDITLVESFLQHPEVDIHATNKHGSTAARMATFANNVNILGLLLNNSKFDPSREIDRTTGFTLLHVAAGTGTLQTMSRLVEDGRFDLNQFTNNDESPLMFAVARGDWKIIEYLLRIEKIDPTKRSKTTQLSPLSIAAIQGNIAAVEAILKRKNLLIGIDVMTFKRQFDLMTKNQKFLPDYTTALAIWQELRDYKPEK